MAHSHAPLSAAVQALRTADKPIALGRNWVRSATSIEWGTTVSLAEADATATGYATSRLADGYVDLTTKPNAAQATWYLKLDLGALRAFDCIWLHGLTLPTTLAAKVADDSTFATNLTTIASATPTTADERWSLLRLDHAAAEDCAYTAQYVLIEMTRAAPFTPSISELFIGSRRQLKHNPTVPHDPSAQRSLTTDDRTVSGKHTRLVHAKGQRTIAAQLQMYEAAYRTDIVDFYEDDLDFGTLPFVWIDLPGSAPHDAYLMTLDEAALAFPWVGPAERDLNLVATEQGPHFRKLEG